MLHISSCIASGIELVPSCLQVQHITSGASPKPLYSLNDITYMNSDQDILPSASEETISTKHFHVPR